MDELEHALINEYLPEINKLHCTMSEEAFLFYVTPLLIGSNDLLVPQSPLPPGIHGSPIRRRTVSFSSAALSHPPLLPGSVKMLGSPLSH